MTNDGARSAEMFQLTDDHNFKGLPSLRDWIIFSASSQGPVYFWPPSEVHSS